jgi:DNA primase
VIANSGTALTERQITLIWKFFTNPIICLDGDESGQKAAYRIAEKLFPLINEENKVHFSIMPNNSDPDDYVKQNGKDGLLTLLKEKEIIQSFIWNYQLGKIDQNNPYEISKFEKVIKSLSYSIQDETLKKYVLEDFLEKIRKLTPIQSSRQDYRFTPFKKKREYQILKETKILHHKRKDLSRVQIIEFSILFIILNYLEIASKKLEELSEIEFLSEKNESLKSEIINSLTEGNNKEDIISKIHIEYDEIIKEINENSNIQIITKNKSDLDVSNLLYELIQNYKEQSNLRKIESLEQKLINNLDENSYLELIKLKSQLNRD